MAVSWEGFSGKIWALLAGKTTEFFDGVPVLQVLKAENSVSDNNTFAVLSAKLLISKGKLPNINYRFFGECRESI
jgi:hypothetical protein